MRCFTDILGFREYFLIHMYILDNLTLRTTYHHDFPLCLVQQDIYVSFVFFSVYVTIPSEFTFVCVANSLVGGFFLFYRSFTFLSSDRLTFSAVWSYNLSLYPDG